MKKEKLQIILSKTVENLEELNVLIKDEEIANIFKKFNLDIPEIFLKLVIIKRSFQNKETKEGE